MDIQEALEIINKYEQSGGIIETEMVDQVENGEWSIDSNGKAVPYTIKNNQKYKSVCATRYTTTVYLYESLKRRYEEKTEWIASFDTLEKALLGIADYIQNNR